MGAMLKYYYTFDYDSSTHTPYVAFDICVFALAEKDFIKNLDALAAEKLKTTLGVVSPENREEVFADAIYET